MNLWVLARRWDRRAHAHADRLQLAEGRVALQDWALEHSLPAAVGDGGGRGLVAGGQQHELLAAVAGKEVARAAGRGGQRLGHAAQAVVSFEVAEQIVEALEAADVERGQR
ncbi:hypothetical protein [Variovorax sp. YR752]|uniref:hypothetical protein n=1 Tax=Variovorax sp. YR752 TaxID=1884383 RepID=UPI003137C3C6